MLYTKHISFKTYAYAHAEPSLKVLLNELHPVRASWYNIGLQLDIPHTTLDCFKQNYSDQSDLMREVLKHWLDTITDPPPTWEAVITALRSPIVDKKNIAMQLEAKYCPPVPSSRNESKSPTTLENSEGISILVINHKLDVSLINVQFPGPCLKFNTMVRVEGNGVCVLKLTRKVAVTS